MLCSFLSTGLLPPWLGLFLGTLFFLLLYQMGFLSWFLFLQFCCWCTGMPLISEYWLCIQLFCQIHLLCRVENINIVNIYALNIGLPKYIKKMLEAFKKDMDSNAIIVGILTSYCQQWLLQTKYQQGYLACVDQLIEYWPVTQSVAAVISSQDICLGCGQGPQQGSQEWEPRIDVSLPLFLPPLASL